jgi:hypothetical protein
VKSSEKTMKLLETERGPAARSFDEETSEGKQLVVARWIE